VPRDTPTTDNTDVTPFTLYASHAGLWHRTQLEAVLQNVIVVSFFIFIEVVDALVLTTIFSKKKKFVLGRSAHQGRPDVMQTPHKQTHT
jgi:uncharacterized membrane protein